MRKTAILNVRQVLLLAIATLPIVIVGFLAKDVIDSTFRSISVIATTTLVFGLALWFADSRPQQQKTLTLPAALLIGLAQCIALIPGTSRSGITITAALLIGLGRTQSARFSFLLAIPTIFGAQLLMMLDLSVSELLSDAWIMISAATLAGLSAYVCIHFFIALVERTGMRPYVYYRIALGLCCLASLRWLSPVGLVMKAWTPFELLEWNIVFKVIVVGQRRRVIHRHTCRR